MNLETTATAPVCSEKENIIPTHDRRGDWCFGEWVVDPSQKICATCASVKDCLVESLKMVEGFIERNPDKPGARKWLARLLLIQEDKPAPVTVETDASAVVQGKVQHRADTGWFALARHDLARGKNPGKTPAEQHLIGELLEGRKTRKELYESYAQSQGVKLTSARVACSHILKMLATAELIRDEDGEVEIAVERVQVKPQEPIIRPDLSGLDITISVRSDFSLGESCFQIDQIVERAAKLKYTHVGLTDLMTVSGIPVFSEKAKKAGIIPVAGVTLHLVDDVSNRSDKDKTNNPVRVKVYPKNDAGMRSIYGALSKSLTPENFYYRQRLCLDDVLALNDVVVTAGDSRGIWGHPDASGIAAALSKRFGDDFYAELVMLDTPYYQQMNSRALAWIRENPNTKYVLGRPSFYAHDEDADSSDVLRGITLNMPLDSKWLQRPMPRNQSLRQKTGIAESRFILVNLGLEMEEIYASIATMTELVGKCLYRFEKMAPCIPKMAENEFAALIEACAKGWTERFSGPVWGHRPTFDEMRTVYKDRLRFELSVIKAMSFSGYFLLVQDIVKWSKENAIRVGPGRGSAGGSLIAYLMGITDCDPIRFNLLFERFINPDRVDLPDADIDFESGKRHLVVDYITRKYGSENVAGIVNFSTLGPASALRDCARMHGLDPLEYACSKQVEKEHGVSLSLTESAERVPDIDKFRLKYPDVWEHALRLEGANRSLSQHAAGVIVSGEPIVNRAVVSTRSVTEDGGLPVVQWDKSKVEDFGLIKMDILGLSTLDMIGKTCEYIQERHGVTVDVLSLPLDDQKVLEAFGKGLTTGVFQFSGSGMKNLLKQMRLGMDNLTFNDLAAATALFRPGPLDAGLCDRYVRIKQGAAAAYYEHPILEECLGDTYGVIVYQEQVMAITRKLCGFSPGDSDGVRKAIGKKDLAKMTEYGGMFIEGAVKSGMNVEAAQRLWDTILGFAGYAFNRSHSVEYSLISWVTMWLKVYYPAEFFAGAMTTAKTDDDLISLVADAQSDEYKLKVHPPDINLSSNRIEISGDCLYAPFQAVKGVSANTAEAIVKLRDYVGGKFEAGEGGAITAFSPSIQKGLFARVTINAGVQARLDAIGALHSLNGIGEAPTHPDRLRARIASIPGYTVDMVKPDRVITDNEETQLRLRQLIGEYTDCKKCSLSCSRHPSVRMGAKPKFMMVFDSPTWEEEKSGKMFEGKNAELIKTALKGIGLTPNNGYFTTLVKAMKPKDKKALTNEQINGCADWLKSEIEILKPPVIVAMGSAAIRWFMPEAKGPSADLAGKTIYRKDLDATVIFGVNPGVLYHDPGKIKLLESAFERLQQVMN